MLSLPQMCLLQKEVMAGLFRIALEMQRMQHLNDYPIYFLPPSKINGAIASFGRSHVVQPGGINCCWELFVTVSKEGNH